ncbi:MAG: relaxase domain-containing protein [Ilumatobacteraceae bacterium]
MPDRLDGIVEGVVAGHAWRPIALSKRSCADAPAGTAYAEYLTAAPGEVPGVWVGRQADGLGVSGDVSVEQLEALLCGRDPVTGTPLGRELVDRPTHGTVRSVTSGDLPDSNVWCTAARHRA